MPALHGKGTTVLVNEFDASAYLDNTDFSLDAGTGETTTYGGNWKTFTAGLNEATVGFTGKWDPLFTELRSELGNDNGVLTYSPGGGATVGHRARLVLFTATSYVETSPVADVVTFGWDVLSEASVGLGWMLHPLAEDTNTTVGTERDDLAATATGWMAHLHVLAVDGGSWVIKLEDAAVSNTYSDVTGGAFTAATGATSQRLTSSSTTTALRRYVRYTATRTGGSVGNGITFALAYSRNR
jgi:hypothetical protein